MENRRLPDNEGVIHTVEIPFTEGSDTVPDPQLRRPEPSPLQNVVAEIAKKIAESRSISFNPEKVAAMTKEELRDLFAKVLQRRERDDEVRINPSGLEQALQGQLTAEYERLDRELDRLEEKIRQWEAYSFSIEERIRQAVKTLVEQKGFKKTKELLSKDIELREKLEDTENNPSETFAGRLVEKFRRWETTRQIEKTRNELGVSESVRMLRAQIRITGLAGQCRRLERDACQISFPPDGAFTEGKRAYMDAIRESAGLSRAIKDLLDRIRIIQKFIEECYRTIYVEPRP